MTPFLKRILYWIIPFLLVGGTLGALIYIQQTGSWEDIVTRTENHSGSAKGPKGFDRPGAATDNEKAHENLSLMNEALASGAIRNCRKIQDEIMQRQCEDQLSLNTGLRDREEESCESVQDEKMRFFCLDKVYQRQATERADKTLCDKIRDVNLKNICLDQVSLAAAESDVSLQTCRQIKSPELKTNCMNRYYLEQSARTTEISFCAGLNAEDLKSGCEQSLIQNRTVLEASAKLAETKKINQSAEELLTVCERIDLDKQAACRNAVYPRLALEKKDLSYCEKISDRDLAGRCLKEQGKQIDQHYLRQAMSEADRQLCENISSKELQSFCVSSLSQADE